MVDEAVILKNHLLLKVWVLLEVTILSISKVPRLLLLELMIHLGHLSVVLGVDGLIGLTLLLDR